MSDTFSETPLLDPKAVIILAYLVLPSTFVVSLLNRPVIGMRFDYSKLLGVGSPGAKWELVINRHKTSPFKDCIKTVVNSLDGFYHSCLM